MSLSSTRNVCWGTRGSCLGTIEYCYGSVKIRVSSPPEQPLPYTNDLIQQVMKQLSPEKSVADLRKYYERNKKFRIRQICSPINSYDIPLFFLILQCMLEAASYRRLFAKTERKTEDNTQADIKSEDTTHLFSTKEVKEEGATHLFDKHADIELAITVIEKYEKFLTQTAKEDPKLFYKRAFTRFFCNLIESNWNRCFTRSIDSIQKQKELFILLFKIFGGIKEFILNVASLQGKRGFGQDMFVVVFYEYCSKNSSYLCFLSRPEISDKMSLFQRIFALIEGRNVKSLIRLMSRLPFTLQRFLIKRVCFSYFSGASPILLTWFMLKCKKRCFKGLEMALRQEELQNFANSVKQQVQELFSEWGKEIYDHPEKRLAKARKQFNGLPRICCIQDLTKKIRELYNDAIEKSPQYLFQLIFAKYGKANPALCVDLFVNWIITTKQDAFLGTEGYLYRISRHLIEQNKTEPFCTLVSKADLMEIFKLVEMLIVRKNKQFFFLLINTLVEKKSLELEELRDLLCQLFAKILLLSPGIEEKKRDQYLQTLSEPMVFWKDTFCHRFLSERTVKRIQAIGVPDEKTISSGSKQSSLDRQTKKDRTDLLSLLGDEKTISSRSKHSSLDKPTEENLTRFAPFLDPEQDFFSLFRQFNILLVLRVGNIEKFYDILKKLSHLFAEKN